MFLIYYEWRHFADVLASDVRRMIVLRIGEITRRWIWNDIDVCLHDIIERIHFQEFIKEHVWKKWPEIRPLCLLQYIFSNWRLATKYFVDLATKHEYESMRHFESTIFYCQRTNKNLGVSVDIFAWPLEQVSLEFRKLRGICERIYFVRFSKK